MRKLQEELEHYKGLYQATRSNKELVQAGEGHINKVVLFCTRASSQERLEFTKYTIKHRMKAPTVNLSSVVTYPSLISESLSGQ